MINNNNNNNNKRQFVRRRNMSVDITRAPYRFYWCHVMSSRRSFQVSRRTFASQTTLKDVSMKYHLTTASSYIRGNGRNFRRRKDEHWKVADTQSNEVQTRAGCRASVTEVNKSVIMNHENHIIDWTGAKIIEQERQDRWNKTFGSEVRSCLMKMAGKTNVANKMVFLAKWQTSFVVSQTSDNMNFDIKSHKQLSTV